MTSDTNTYPFEDVYPTKVGPALAKLKAQSLSFWAALFYLFFEYVRPQSIWREIDILPWTQTTLLVCMFALFLDAGRKKLVSAPTNAMFAILAVICLLASVFAFRPQLSFEQWQLFFPWVLIYFTLINAVTGRTRFYLFLILFLLCSFKMSQHGFRSWAMAGFGSRSWGVTGAPGFFRNSGEVGIQMCIFLPIATMFTLALKDKMSKWMWLALTFVPISAAATVIASNSRGAVLGAAAAMFWLVTAGRSRIKALLGVGVAFALAYLVIPPEFLDRFREAGVDQTSLARLNYWRNGLDVMANHPILGLGPGNWVDYYWIHYEPNFTHGGVAYVELPHNVFIQGGAELGIPALVVFILMIIITFRMNSQARALARKAGDTFIEKVSLGFDCGMIGFLVSAQFISVFYYPYAWIGFALSVMMLTAAREAAGLDPHTGKLPGRLGSNRAAINPLATPGGARARIPQAKSDLRTT